LRTVGNEQAGARNRFVPDSPGSSPYEDAFFEDPGAARAEIADIVERLGAGFERLAALAAMGSSRP
jgi:hypothetical protein